MAPLRPKERHVIHYAVLDDKEEDFTCYRVVDRTLAGDHEEALIHTQVVHAHPSSWPTQLKWRPKGVVFTNGMGIGYVRQASLERRGHGFRKELARRTK